jgi:transcription elongation factor GreA
MPPGRRAGLNVTRDRLSSRLIFELRTHRTNNLGKIGFALIPHRPEPVGALFCPFEDTESMANIPLTVIGAEKMRAELQELKTVQRPAIISAIAEARAHGDLSENAEYHAAKERQSFIEGRIIELEGKLSNAQIIDPTRIDADGRCVFGATVELEDDSGQTLTYQIVGEDEADIKAHKISISSPMARALIGKYSGDVAEVQAPGGVREYEILDVKYI